MDKVRMIRRMTALAVALLASASSVAAQQHAGAPDRTLTIQLGGINSDVFVSEGRTFPFAALRADWRLSRHVLVEVGGSYARGRIELPNHTGPVSTYTQETSQLATTTVGIQAELPLPYLRPYIGIATGLYLRLDPPGGDRFVSTTQEIPVGVRVPLSPRLGARAEARVRYDEQMGGDEALTGELALGLSWRY